MRRKHSRSRGRQRGAALAIVGISMVVLAAMAVIGVDVGRNALTAGELQAVADAGAVAYAKTMLDNEINETSDDPFVAADLVVDDNSIDGKTASRAGFEYAVGRWDFDRRDFRPGGFPTNAVKATGQATVTNIFAGMFGDNQSTVDRYAVAAYGGAGAARPTLPVAVGECYFKKFQRSGDCSDLPRLKQVPEKAENSCWTSLQEDAATSAAEVVSMLPPECCHGGRCGGGEPSPLIGVGDNINVMNGSATTILHLLAECVDGADPEFIIPVVECGKCNQLTEVVGFATVRLTRVSDTGRDKGIDIEALCSDETDNGPPGPNRNFGRQTLALVD